MIASSIDWGLEPVRRKTRLSFNHELSFGKTPPKRPVRWVFAVLMLPLLGALLTYGLRKDFTPSVPPPALPAAEATTDAPEVAAPAAPEPPGERLDFIVRPDDTLEKIFRQLNLSVQDLTAILTVPGARQNLARIRPGEQITVVHDDGAVRSLNHRISETEILSIVRSDGGFAAEVIATPIEVEAVPVRGTIDASLFAAARAAGLSPASLLALANDVYAWEIDFALDIRPGDRFSLIYENKYRAGEYLGEGRILAAEFINTGETYRAVYYASADGKVRGYFTPEGRSLRRPFLRTPLDFTRVSSTLDPARGRPVLNTIRAHQGVDYPAPAGTIIKAAGDGRVSFIGEKGDYGKIVTLEHGGRIATLYGHLSSFEPGLRTGQQVKQGDALGYVGRSGAATGPHLHYEFRVDGTPVDPRTAELPDTPLPAEYMADFESRSATLLAAMGWTRDAAAAAMVMN